MRVFARRRAVEVAGAAALEGSRGMTLEARERAFIGAELTKRVLWAAVQLDGIYHFDDVVAVDGSFDPKPAVRGEGLEAPRQATAWGAWDGRQFRGGALPPRSGNHAAELVAIAETLRRFAGETVLILCDCQSALVCRSRSGSRG